MNRWLGVAAVVLCMQPMMCDEVEAEVDTSSMPLQIERAFTQIRPRRPVAITHAGDGSNRLFIVTQQGVIHVIPNRRDVKETKTFLDIEDRDAAMIRNRLDQMEKMISQSAAYRIEQAISTDGIEAGLETYRDIKSDPENKLYFEESEFNAMGYRFMGTGRMREAIEAFKLNVELYPKSWNVYDSLAEAYMKSGDAQNAVKKYKKSLELNPENANAKEMLKKLEKK